MSNFKLDVFCTSLIPIRKIFAYKDGAVKDNLLRKIRQFTDELYPWGQSRLDYLRAARSADLQVEKMAEVM